MLLYKNIFVILKPSLLFPFGGCMIKIPFLKDRSFLSFLSFLKGRSFVSFLKGRCDLAFRRYARLRPKAAFVFEKTPTTVQNKRPRVFTPFQIGAKPCQQTMPTN